MNKKKGIIIAAVCAAALTAVVLLLVFLPKGGGDKNASTIDEGTAINTYVDKDGVHQVDVLTENGEIKNNSYGTLMDYYPADISTIHVENTNGSFDVLSETPEGEATVYTIKGLEGFDLKSGNPDLIASAAASLDFSKVATLEKDKGAEFGFDKPRATVTVTYDDKTKSIITVGGDAPQQAGTYVRFGTGDAVYVVDSETVAPFLYDVTELISLKISDAADSSENNALSSVKLSGSAFTQDIALAPNTDNNYYASYKLTAPVSRLANENESSLITGSIRDLYATSVRMVNPSEAQLSELGLTKPYAKVEAVYPDVNIELTASNPDGDGNVNLMINGKNVVYTIAAEKVPWVATSYEKLCYEYVLYPKLTALSKITVNTGGKEYVFDISSRESVTTDNSGSETTATVTTVTYNGKDVPLGDFTTFFDKLSLIMLADPKPDTAGNDALSVKYDYADGSSDSLRYTDKGDTCAAELNGEASGHARKADVNLAAKALTELLGKL